MSKRDHNVRNKARRHQAKTMEKQRAEMVLVQICRKTSTGIPEIMRECKLATGPVVNALAYLRGAGWIDRTEGKHNSIVPTEAGAKHAQNLTNKK